MMNARRHIFAEICLSCVAMLLLAGAAGCGYPRASASWKIVPAAGRDASHFTVAEMTVRKTFPPVYKATQRAIISVHNRQFVCDGYLTASPAEGWHLALISTLGLVTDIRVTGDGITEVLKVTPLLPEKWAREYVAQDLRWIFTSPPPLAPAGYLDDGRPVLETLHPGDGKRMRYVCGADGSRWEELEISKGNRRLFHALLSGHGSVPGWRHAVPSEIEADAGTHQLHLRTAAMDVPAEESR